MARDLAQADLVDLVGRELGRVTTAPAAGTSPRRRRVPDADALAAGRQVLALEESLQPA